MLRLFVFLTLATLFLNTVYASSNDVNLEPKWSDFCPKEFLDAQESVNVLEVFNVDDNETYWYQRRMSFRKSLKKCEILNGNDKLMCYQELRAQELAENTKHETQVQAKNEAYKRQQYQNLQYDCSRLDTPVRYLGR